MFTIPIVDILNSLLSNIFFKTKEHEKMNDPSETISTHCAHKIISGVQKKRRKKKLRTIIISAFWELLRSYVQSALLGPFPDMKVWIVPCSVIKKTRYFNFLLGAVNFGFEMREDFVFYSINWPLTVLINKTSKKGTNCQLKLQKMPKMSRQSPDCKQKLGLSLLNFK